MQSGSNLKLDELKKMSNSIEQRHTKREIYTDENHQLHQLWGRIWGRQECHWQDGGAEGRALIFSVRTPKLQLFAEQLLTGECWIPHTQKKILHIQGQRRSPNKTVRGVKSHLEPNLIPARDAWRAQTKPWVHQDPETPQRLSQTCVWVSCRGMCQLWPATGAGALGAATWVTQPVA